jgi:hypothetical protein
MKELEAVLLRYGGTANVRKVTKSKKNPVDPSERPNAPKKAPRKKKPTPNGTSNNTSVRGFRAALILSAMLAA